MSTEDSFFPNIQCFILGTVNTIFMHKTHGERFSRNVLLINLFFQIFFSFFLSFFLSLFLSFFFLSFFVFKNAPDHKCYFMLQCLRALSLLNMTQKLCILRYYIVSIVLYCIVFYCILLYCIVLHWNDVAYCLRETKFSTHLGMYGFCTYTPAKN